jgi:exopolysaccharide production protein ExoZ
MSALDPIAATETSSRKPQLPSLQVLRFAAAFAVVLFHVGSGLVEQGVLQSNPFEFGSKGVDVFFVLSGFIIAYTSDPAKGFAYFAWRRIARVVPIYWLLTLGIIVIASLKPDLLNSTVVTVETVLKSFLFLPYEKSNGAVQPLLFLGWTLCYEMFFYLIFGICMLFGKGTVWRTCGVIAILLALRAVWPAGSVEWRFYTDPILAEFALGMLIQKLFSASTQLKSGSGSLSLLLLIAAPVAYVIVMQFAPGIPASAAFSGLLVIACLCWKMPHTRLMAVLVLLGDASYSLYLVHPYLIQLAIKLQGPDTSWPIVVTAVTCASLLAVVASVFLYRLIERPAQSVLMGAIYNVRRRAAV